MADQRDDDAILVPVPEKLVPRWPSFTAEDWKFTILWFCMFAIVRSLVDATLVTILGWAGWGVLTWKFSDNARLYYAIGMTVRGWKIRYVDHGWIWRPIEDATSRRRTRKVVERLMSGSSEVIPLVVNWLEESDIGLVHNFRKGDDSVIITGDGSDIATLSLREQRVRLERLAQTTLRLAGRPDVRAGISYVQRFEPVDVGALRDDIAAVNIPEVLVPEAHYVDYLADLTPEQRRHLNLHTAEQENLELMSEVACDTVMAAVLTIKRTGPLLRMAKRRADKEPHRHWWRRKPKPEPRDYASLASYEQLAIFDLAQLAVEELTACGVGNPHVLTKDEAERFLRGQWDVLDMPLYYDEVREGNNNPSAHWPTAIRVTKSAIIMGNTATTVLRLRKLPAPQLPHFMRALSSLELDYPVFTLAGETIGSFWDYVAIGRMKGLFEGFLGAIGFTMDMKSGQAVDKIEERQQIVNSTSFLHLYNLLVVVRTPVDRKDLDAYLAYHQRLVSQTVKDLRSRFNIEAKPIKGEAWQMRALWSGGGFNML